MEAHPIPQNVTSFQFRLVGDMTLKQFLYLASGLGIAYSAFLFLAPAFPILAWPVISISVLLGLAFAFLPVGDRPLDYWLKAFLKAIYSPTKRVWVKNGHSFAEEPLFRTRFSVFMSSLGHVVQPELTPVPQKPTPPAPPTPPKPLPTAEELSETVRLAREAQNLQQQVVQTDRDLTQIKQVSSLPGAKTEVYAEKLDALLNNLQRLIKETTEIQTKLSRGISKEGPTNRALDIRVVTPPPKTRVQLILTSLPNVINGIALDSLGNYLPDTVVVVRDRDNLPVRALKTNKLGQFSGATPLPNGTYTVELEKDDFVFDILKLELDGKILPPLSIAAKKVAGNS